MKKNGQQPNMLHMVHLDVMEIGRNHPQPNFWTECEHTFNASDLNQFRLQIFSPIEDHKNHTPHPHWATVAEATESTIYKNTPQITRNLHNA